MMTGALIGALALCVLVVVWALMLHHQDRERLYEWNTSWNTAVALCCWRTTAGLCLEPEEAVIHLSPEEIRDPRKQSQQTRAHHPFAEARLIDRIAGQDPVVAMMAAQITPAGARAADRAIHFTDGLLAVLASVGDSLRSLWGRGVSAVEARRQRDEAMGIRGTRPDKVTLDEDIP